jgi:hypothetical protein
MTKEKTWKRVPADSVRLVWKCPTCKSVAHMLPEEASIPYCCDDGCKNRECEMEYSHAEVLK